MILIIEDDLSVAETERDYLQINGLEAEIESGGKQGLQKALSGKYELVVLDIVLPDIDGFAICRSIRSALNIPIVFVSARCDEIDVVRGLGLGADDYIKKPFSGGEFIARIKAALLRYRTLTESAAHPSADTLVIRGLQIDKNARRVYIDGTEIPMPVKEYELLLFLAENPNIVLSKERLFDRIWGIDAIGDTSTVTVHIQRIRQKINRTSNSDEYIETVWGVGYRFKN